MYHIERFIRAKVLKNHFSFSNLQTIYDAIDLMNYVKGDYSQNYNL
jgi:hypothetical protein